MGSAGEEIEGLEMGEVIFWEQGNEVASLGGGVAGKINDSGWKNIEKTLNEIRVATGTGWVENDSDVGSDKIEGGFGFGEISGDIRGRGGGEMSGFRGSRVGNRCGR